MGGTSSGVHQLCLGQDAATQEGKRVRQAEPRRPTPWPAIHPANIIVHPEATGNVRCQPEGTVSDASQYHPILWSGTRLLSPASVLHRYHLGRMDGYRCPRASRYSSRRGRAGPAAAMQHAQAAEVQCGPELGVFGLFGRARQNMWPEGLERTFRRATRWRTVVNLFSCDGKLHLWDAMGTLENST